MTKEAVEKHCKKVKKERQAATKDVKKLTKKGGKIGCCIR